MPWYDEANPDYTELDQIIDGVLFDAKAFAEVVVQRNQALDAYGDCIADNVRLRGAAQEWADLCNDYDLNERGQAIMGRLRAALAK